MLLLLPSLPKKGQSLGCRKVDLAHANCQDKRGNTQTACPPVAEDGLFGYRGLVAYISRMKTKRAVIVSILIVVCAVLILVIKFGPGVFSSRISSETDKEECLRLAREYLDHDEPESAIYPLLLAVEKDQRDFRPHNLLARAYYSSGIYHLAEKECSESLRIEPGNPEAVQLLCRIKYQRGREKWKKDDLKAAISDFQLVVEQTQDQSFLDSVAFLTGGRLKMSRLTNDLFSDDAPSFSPDGRKIVYHSDTSYFLEDYGLQKKEVKKSRIMLMDADGGNQRSLSAPGNDRPSERFPRFSHDGKRLVYEKENSAPRLSDTVFNSDRDIFLKDLGTGEERRLTRDANYDGLPGFSPDDSQVIFVSDRSGGSGIFTLNLKTGKITHVSAKESWDEKIGLLRHARGPILPYCPGYSPDGSKIVLHAGWDRRGVLVFDVRTREWDRLTDPEMDCFFPSFSPDGTRIVFVCGRPEREDLYLIGVDGSDQTRLTYDGGTKRYPSFSPDGQSIVFAGKRKDEPDNYFEIYLLELDRSVSREILKERLSELEAAVLEKAGGRFER
jgi:Tol biopolymer transport system component